MEVCGKLFRTLFQTLVKIRDRGSGKFLQVIFIWL